MKDASTKDILENIRKQLEAANNNLKQAAEKGELEEEEVEGDSVNLNSEVETQKIEEEEEPTDEVRIEEKTPAKEKEEVLLGLAAVKQNLQAGIKNESTKQEEMKQPESLEPDDDENWEFLEEEAAPEETPEEQKIDAPSPEAISLKKSDEALTEEEGSPETSPTPHEPEELKDSDLEEEEDFEDEEFEEEEHAEIQDDATAEELIDEDEFEEEQTLEHATAKPYSYYEKEEVQKIPDYSNHEIIPEGQIASEIADKISASLSSKFAKMLDDAKVLKSSDAINDLKVKDLVLEALPPILEKWIDKNQNLILNVVEKVAEKNISSALSKIKF